MVDKRPEPYKERLISYILKRPRLKRAGTRLAFLLHRIYPFGQRVRTRYLSLSRHFNLRIVLIGDIHADPDVTDEKKLKQLTEQLLSIEGVSFYAFVGDFVNDQHVDMIEHIKEMIQSLPAPSYCVFGNHDHRAGIHKIHTSLKEAGAVVLVNESVQHGKANIVGIDSWCMKKFDVTKAFTGIGIDDMKSTIVLGHEPYLATMHNAFLHLAGHSHHGQIRIPPFKRVFFVPWGSDPYPAGLYRQDERLVYTTSGIGYSAFPLRVGSPPEIAVIDI